MYVPYFASSAAGSHSLSRATIRPNPQQKLLPIVSGQASASNHAARCLYCAIEIAITTAQSDNGLSRAARHDAMLTMLPSNLDRLEEHSAGATT